MLRSLSTFLFNIEVPLRAERKTELDRLLGLPPTPDAASGRADFAARFGRGRVCVLHKEEVEIPSDYHGVEWVRLDPGKAWHLKVANELKAAGCEIDANKLLSATSQSTAVPRRRGTEARPLRRAR